MSGMNNKCSNNRLIIPEIAIDKKDIRTNPKQPVSGKLIFLTAGRIIYRKGISFLLDALDEIPPTFNYECRIVGDGSELQKLKLQAEQSPNLDNHVRFIGALPYDKMECEYQNADVFILPSIRETTGSVVLEAMANALPVITIDKFGASGIVDNETGWLYKGTTRENYISSLKDILIYCVEHPEEVREKGWNARNKALDYTWERKTTYYNRIYDELIRAKNR